LSSECPLLDHDSDSTLASPTPQGLLLHLKDLKSDQIMALEFNGKSKMKTDPTSKNIFESLAI
jgi:hypothetical protein